MKDVKQGGLDSETGTELYVPFEQLRDNSLEGDPSLLDERGHRSDEPDLLAAIEAFARLAAAAGYEVAYDGWTVSTST